MMEQKKDQIKILVIPSIPKYFITIPQDQYIFETINDLHQLNKYLQHSNPEVVIIIDQNESLDIPDLLIRLQQRVSAPIIVFSPVSCIHRVVHCIQLGAQNFIELPNQQEVIIKAIEDAVKQYKLWREIHTQNHNQKQNSLGRLIGASVPMQQLYTTIKSIAKTQATVFIHGASGTGKELVAHAIHDLSNRADQPFVAINCGAIPANLLESELFGHERGAFTGAIAQVKGKFEQANKGTLFLDELCELPLDLQVKLLRVLQDRKLVRLGGRDLIQIDLRIICATNRDAKKEIEEGRFREDLYYRLNVVPLHTPSLKERRSDIPILLTHFLNIFNEKYSKYFVEFSLSAIQRLINYDWPGNVRELENLVERLVVLNEGSIIEEKFLPREIRNAEPLDLFNTRNILLVPDVSQAISSESEKIGLTPVQTVQQTLKQHIINALIQKNGNISQTAQLLHIGQATLYRKIKEYQLDIKSFRKK